MRKVIIDEQGIRFDGFDEVLSVPEVDRESIGFVRAMLWAVQRITEVIGHVEVSRRSRNELSAKMMQAIQRTRSGLH